MNQKNIHKKSKEIVDNFISQDTPVLSVLSSCTLDLIKPHFICESYAQGYLLKPYFAPFNQFEQILLDKNNIIWNKNNKAFWINIRIEDVFPDFINYFYKNNIHDSKEILINLKNRIISIIDLIRNNSSETVLVSNLIVPQQFHLNIFDQSNPDGLNHLISYINKEISNQLNHYNGCYVFDLNNFIFQVGWENWNDTTLNYMAKFPINMKVIKSFNSLLVRYILATIRTCAKVIIIDLDNTIWGGALGDDGIEGIHLGNDFPGIIFKDIQKVLLSLKDQGFLLAIASKNDKDLVLYALDNHPEMILRSKDFVSIYANWNNKSDNIMSISNELNLGLDSFIFIDDNPVERSLVNSALPLVNILNLPTEPIGFLESFKKMYWIDKPTILEEDLNKTSMYNQNISRNKLKNTSKSLEDFLKSIKMKAEVELLDNLNQERIHQLINKTNQFNFTTKRYNIEELIKISTRNDCYVFYLKLKDKFSNLGLVACAILKQYNSKSWAIDSLVMSCRVMNRNVEFFFIDYLVEFLKARGCEVLKGIYIPTKRNHIIKDFFPKLGFKKEVDSINNEESYILELNKIVLPNISFIKSID